MGGDYSFLYETQGGGRLLHSNALCSSVEMFVDAFSKLKPGRTHTGPLSLDPSAGTPVLYEVLQLSVEGWLVVQLKQELLWFCEKFHAHEP